ncbi:MAG: potassium channel protein [Actinomycetales bacterium]|nr:potassium channel protein [Actinomycetales bacterium]
MRWSPTLSPSCCWSSKPHRSVTADLKLSSCALSPFAERPWSRPDRARVSRRHVVNVPDDSANTDVIFILMRRLRLPLIILVCILTIATFGMSQIDGVDFDGNPRRLTVFESFYFMSYTAATVGYTELFPYTSAQRMWVTASIYAGVLGWAFALGTFFSILGDQTFKDALGLQRFRRAVHRINEPFHIVAGFGNAGRLVSNGLNNLGHRFVVIDSQRSRIDVLTADQLESDPPINLAVLMSAHLLRPELSVIARSGQQDAEEQMYAFDPDAVINPYDRYGGYLVLALQRPITHQLLTWVLAANGSEMPPRREGLAAGKWIIYGDGEFAQEVFSDLTRAELEVVIVNPADGVPDVTDAVGLVVGTSVDTDNLSTASRARLSNPDLFVAVRQRTHTNALLLEALDFDSVFSPTDLVAQEVLARLTTPHLWRFITKVAEQEDAWSEELITRLEATCGSRSPRIRRLIVNEVEAPAVTRWLRGGGKLALGELVSGSSGPNTPTAAVVLMMARNGEDVLTPADDIQVREGDVLLIAGRSVAFADLDELLRQDSTVAFVATGEYPDDTAVWRMIRRWSERRKAS